MVTFFILVDAKTSNTEEDGSVQLLIVLTGSDQLLLILTLFPISQNGLTLSTLLSLPFLKVIL